jgi:hypothetical protein
MKFSVVVPAHNEEALLPRGLRAITAAAERTAGDVEVIVVTNRCTDSTAALARRGRRHPCRKRRPQHLRGAQRRRPCRDRRRLVTIDADCVMSAAAFADIERLLVSGRYVGGGTKVRQQRRRPASAPRSSSSTHGVPRTRLAGCSGRADFGRSAGSTSRCSAEDLDFARRLRAHGGARVDDSRC